MTRQKIVLFVLMKVVFILAIIAAVFIAMPRAKADVLAPDALIQATAQEVMDVVKQDKAMQAGDKTKLMPMVEARVLPHFDFDRMTRLAMGRNWRDATPDQRQRLVTEFRTLLVRTYVGAFTRFQNQTVTVKPVKLAPDDTEVLVNTSINKPGEQPIAVDYEMEKTPDGWKAFDLIVEGASLVNTYRGTFNDQIQQGGIDGLIKSLADKNATAAVAKK